jgi:CDP-glucose 4,6-dehydratase
LAADVVGLALSPPTSPNHWDLIRLSAPEHRVDVRDASAVAQVVQKARPELVFHLAAQSLVRRSYREPLESWSTNVMGTANLLEACRQADSVRAIVVVTSDKCYENLEQKRGYREDDRLSGHDPYSASKSATELVVSSYRSAFFNRANSPLLATARAGNVVGGGDWSEDRLVPDLIRAVASGSDLEIRSPDAVRPWQHVLESLSGYLLLGQRLLQGDRKNADAWNFGPGVEDHRKIADVLTQMHVFWPNLQWNVAQTAQAYETQLLYLDSSKARAKLNWQPVWSLDQTIRATAEWYRAFLESGRVESRGQLRQYIDDARRAHATWTLP